MTLQAHRYERAGRLALDPSALLEMFMLAAEPPAVEEVDGVAVVSVRGPLDHYAGSWCDSYEAICARVAAALASGARAVVLRIDSPGGELAGCFEAAVRLRELCAASGKQVYAYVDERACSAAYALACAAPAGIFMSRTATVGSIGVLCTRTDVSAANASRGVRVALVTSGAYKAAGHPDAPITEAELLDAQRLVDAAADEFYALVVELRGSRAGDAGAIAALEARCYPGLAAVAAGLADQVCSFESLLARASRKVTDMPADKGPWETAREALQEAAKGEDANAVAAKRALAAMDAEPEEEKEPAGDEDASAEDETDEEKKKKAPPVEDAAAASASSELTALAEVHKLRAEIRRERDRSDVTAMLAGRKDLAPRMVALLKTQTPAQVRAWLDALAPADDAPVAKPKPAAAAQAQGTRGATQGGEPSRLSPQAKRELDIQMGLVQTRYGVQNTDYKLQLGVPVPLDEQATKPPAAKR